MTRQSLWAAMVVATAAASLTSGCLTVRKALFLVDDLKGKEVESVTLSHFPEGAVCPGDRIKMVAVVKAGGQEYVTTGAGDGSLLWDAVRVRPSAGYAAQEGDELIVTVSSEARELEGSSITLKARLTDNPGIKVEPYTLDLRYDCAYVVDYSGKAGSWGYSGQSGYDAGGDHGDGGDGGDGGRGGYGAAGKDVDVAYSTVRGPHGPLVQACVGESRDVAYSGYTLENSDCFIFDPEGGELTVRANGGQGGRGGSGGSGGSSGRKSGSDGRDGRGGPGGDGGRGGKIQVSVDPSAKRYMDLLVMQNRGGTGGDGGSILASDGRQGYGGGDPHISTRRLGMLFPFSVDKKETQVAAAEPPPALEEAAPAAAEGGEAAPGEVPADSAAPVEGAVEGQPAEPAPPPGPPMLTETKTRKVEGPPADEVCEYREEDDDYVCNKKVVKAYTTEENEMLTVVEGVKLTTSRATKDGLDAQEEQVLGDDELGCIAAVDVTFSSRSHDLSINWNKATFLVNGSAVAAVPSFAGDAKTALRSSVVPKGSKFTETVRPDGFGCLGERQEGESAEEMEIVLSLPITEDDSLPPAVWKLERRFLPTSEAVLMKQLERPDLPAPEADVPTSAPIEPYPFQVFTYGGSLASILVGLVGCAGITGLGAAIGGQSFGLFCLGGFAFCGAGVGIAAVVALVTWVIVLFQEGGYEDQTKLWAARRVQMAFDRKRQELGLDAPQQDLPMAH